MANQEEKLVKLMATNLVELGFQPPQYKKPKWYNLRLRRKLAYYDKVGWPYQIVGS